MRNTLRPVLLISIAFAAVLASEVRASEAQALSPSAHSHLSVGTVGIERLVLARPGLEDEGRPDFNGGEEGLVSLTPAPGLGLWTDCTRDLVESKTALDEGWHFSLAIPAVLPGFDGEAGINGLTTGVDVSPDQIIRNLDMAVFFRGEVSKGRLGVMIDVISMNLSASMEPGNVVKEMEVHFDETLVEPALRWRILSSARGWLDVYAGVRYVNLFQSADIEPDSLQIQQASTALVDAVGEQLRAGVTGHEVSRVIESQLGSGLSSLENGIATLPSGPIAGRLPGVIKERIREIIEARKQELIDAIRAGAQDKVEAIKRDLAQQIANGMQSRLDTRVSRLDDWWDPFLGLRGRYHLSGHWYLSGRGDLGGFCVGSDLAWQMESAVGFQITPHIFVEAGYRLLGMDYEDHGLTYDVLTHGFTLTFGGGF